MPTLALRGRLQRAWQGKDMRSVQHLLMRLALHAAQANTLLRMIRQLVFRHQVQQVRHQAQSRRAALASMGQRPLRPTRMIICFSLRQIVGKTFW